MEGGLINWHEHCHFSSVFILVELRKYCNLCFNSDPFPGLKSSFTRAYFVHEFKLKMYCIWYESPKTPNPIKFD